MSGRAMKDSGLEWIGEIPEHWETARFRHHFRCRKGLTITKANLVEAGVPVLNYGEIHSKYGFEFTLNKDDAKLAVDAGADAIIVSNHGGRQLDGAPSTISVLSEIICPATTALPPVTLSIFNFGALSISKLLFSS